MNSSVPGGAGVSQIVGDFIGEEALDTSAATLREEGGACSDRSLFGSILEEGNAERVLLRRRSEPIRSPSASPAETGRGRWMRGTSRVAPPYDGDAPLSAISSRKGGRPGD